MKIIQESTRFSDSMLWSLQEEAYRKFGVKAWAEKAVPFYATSNPYIARQFALMIHAYFEDSYRDKTERLHIFDLGAGSGRLAFLILKLLPSAIARQIRYVMTDISKDNIEFWKNHPLLAPYIKEGMLDFALLHHADDPKDFIKPLKNPAVLIATYFFDTIPQSLYRIDSSGLKEGFVSLQGKEGESLIESLECVFEFKECTSKNSLLIEYAKNIKEGTFLFPEAGFSLIEKFARLSNGKLLLLAADQGVCQIKQMNCLPKMAKHSSFSFPVNYHAFDYYFSKRGISMLPTFPDPAFIPYVGILGDGEYERTKSAFLLEFDPFNPSDYWKFAIQEHGDDLTFEKLFLLLKLGGFDPANFHYYFQTLYQMAPKLSQDERDNLLAAVKGTYDHFYPVSPIEGDFVMNLGVLLMAIDRNEEALFYLQKAIELRGETEQNKANYIICAKRVLEKL